MFLFRQRLICVGYESLHQHGNNQRDNTYPVITPGEPVPVPYPVPADVDTNDIFAAFFAKVQDKITLADDSSIFVSIEYLITQNRLKWIIPTIQNRRSTTIIHNTSIIESVKPGNKYFVGIGLGRSITSFGLAPSIALLTKKDHLYSFSYDGLTKMCISVHIGKLEKDN
jgi:hypothetical protein